MAVTLAGTPSARSVRCSPDGSLSWRTVTVMPPLACLATVQAASRAEGGWLAGWPDGLAGWRADPAGKPHVCCLAPGAVLLAGREPRCERVVVVPDGRAAARSDRPLADAVHRRPHNVIGVHDRATHVRLDLGALFGLLG